MRVAIIAHSFVPAMGGTESYVRELADFLSSHSHDVTVLTLEPLQPVPKITSNPRVSKMLHEDYSVRKFLNPVPFIGLQYSPSLEKYYVANKSKFDLVIITAYSSLTSVQVSMHRGPQIVLIPNYHGEVSHSVLRSALHLPFRLLGSLMVKQAAVIICVSGYEYTRLTTDFPEAKAKATVIREGVEPRAGARKRRDINRILTVCRLEEYKGVQYILRVLGRLNDSFLDVVGEGEYLQELQRISRQLGICDKVIFHGSIPDERLDELYRTDGVFVLLSKFEAFGRTVGEALSAGMPSVVLRGSALNDWIDNKSCFGVTDPSNSASVADAILLARNSHVEVMVPKSIDHFVQVESILRQVLAKRRAL
jgi:glycosyltransferase involved in cell wall biosynthesis